MLTPTSELKTSASTGLIVRIYIICVTLATSYLDKVRLNFHCEGIVLKFNKLATPAIHTQCRLDIDWIIGSLRDICLDLVTIQ